MKRYLKIIGIASVAGIAGLAVLVYAAEKYTSRAEFCGTRCHTMKNPYQAWVKDKHKTGPHSKIKDDVACVDCHYAPGENSTLRAKFKGLGQLFSYLATKEKEVRKRAVVKDAACTTPECHPKDKLFPKKIEYKKAYKTEYKGKLLPFTHKTHSEKSVEGQKLHCSSCHIHSTAGRHFEVPKDLCFLCHFRKSEDNKGRAKCSICHEVSNKPLEAKKDGQDPDEKPAKPITHQSIEKSKVPCSSCHFELIRGNVDVKKESCLDCHHDPTPELMKKSEDRKAMHDAHVTKQTARCLNCHQPIEHKEFSYLDTAIRNCSTCHPEPHIYQKMLLAGEGGPGIAKFPIAHDPMRTNCQSCHTKDGHDEKGRKVRRAEGKACVECHGDKDKEKIAKQWKADVAEDMKTARDLEKNVVAAIEEAKGKVSETDIAKMRALLKDARVNLKIVDAGGGVHNKKFSMLLIDTAVKNFEDVLKGLETAKKGTHQ
ncbi:MAG: cytochrome c3 family protein [Desulfobacteria bacterium]